MPEQRRQYPQTFKDEAIRLVLEHGYTCDRAGEQLGVDRDDPAALRARIAELEKELRRAQTEREILPLNVSIPDCRDNPPARRPQHRRREIFCCVNTVAKLMKQHDIRSKRRRRFVARTTDSNHDRPMFENKLGRAFEAEAPNRK